MMMMMMMMMILVHPILVPVRDSQATEYGLSKPVDASEFMENKGRKQRMTNYPCKDLRRKAARKLAPGTSPALNNIRL